MSSARNVQSSADAVVVGAGFAGLYQLYRLLQQGLDVRAFEAGGGVGGTWYWNRYPGARVDSQSHIYQYWFSDELLSDWNWTERFPAQPETERYLNHVCDRFELRPHITFGTRVTAAHFDEASGRWKVTTDTGEFVDTQFLVMNTGGLSAPLTPPFKGHETFRGAACHTSHWPREGIDLRGKRVAVIGTGATGIQVIQTIASEVAQLTVFQRTANYTIPMRNPKLEDADRAALRARYPMLKDQIQRTFAGFDFDFDERAWADIPPEERRRLMLEAWEDGSLKFWVGVFREVFFDQAVCDEFSEFVRERIRARVKDPKVAEKLVPSDHGFGTRRVPLESGYYEAFNRDNVLLVDVNDDPIEFIDETGINTRISGHHDFDVIIYATGFDAGTGALTRIDVRGRGGISLKELWGRGIRTTMGLQVHGFPNMFMTMAPFSPAAAFCNVPTCIDQQVDWISDAIAHVRRKDARSIEPKAETEASWLAHADEVSSPTLVAQTNKSWYTGANVEGKERRLLAYVGGAGPYRDICDRVKTHGFEGFSVA
jgi:acetone monooxygenase